MDFFEPKSLYQGDIEPRPHLWDIMTRRLGITKGIEGWSRLQRLLNKKLVLEWVEEDESRTRSVSEEQKDLLWHLFHNLYQDLTRLPNRATWGQYVDEWKGYMEKYLRLEVKDRNQSPSRSSQSGRMLISLLDGLRRMEVLNMETTLENFIQTYLGERFYC